MYNDVCMDIILLLRNIIMANVLTDGNAEIKVSIYDVLSKTINSLLKSAADKLKGSLRRQFIAETVIELGAGGQSIAERELGWNRGTIRKGMHELVSGIKCVDAYNLRGRKKSEVRLKNLERDIRDIVEIKTQADATLHTTRQYVKMTVEEIRKQLIEQKNYKDEEIPKRRTINNVLKRLSLHLKKVLKNKPFKKIPKTDAIFDEVDKMNREADASEDILRLSMDAKATVKLGPFSRGGRNRNKIEAADHDFGGGSLTPFNILLPKYDELFISFAESKVTSDYIWDRLDDLWPEFRNKYNPSTLLLNLDNGPENSSRRTQFIKRAVDFANTNQVKVQLASCIPEHCNEDIYCIRKQNVYFLLQVFNKTRVVHIT